MRIDLLITELDVGGAERCLVGLAKFLAVKGDKVRVISLGPKSPPGRTQLIDSTGAKQVSKHIFSTVILPFIFR